ncbi:unnamed protein product [Adineta steineri]|uniref:ADP ribosyltransferase domain-containing protein n=1 Tax=Adineta steineri TaxID=433720 RepID=A0A819AVV4_9BILA|nr:unnamed protein product [Adineta steineri]CAF3783214.1 unnamed protein product [Adineta steineri]
MDNNNNLLKLAEEQQEKFNELLSQLYDKSVEGLTKTRHEVNDLQEKHAWYASNIIQIQKLKSKITNIQKEYDLYITGILNEITKQKQHAKEILMNALNQLESAVNTEQIKASIHSLIHDIDFLVGNISKHVYLILIFSSIGIGGIIAMIIAGLAGSSFFGIATMGLGTVVGSVGSEILFKDKLEELDTKLSNDIGKVINQKDQQIEKLNEYFECFKDKILYCNYNRQTSFINIVWYDKQIKNFSNQNSIKRLRNGFSKENYCITEFDNEDQLIKLITSNIESNLILITSGSSGEQILSQIGYYFHIKGIIIYCQAVQYHKTWTKQYKKVLLVTNTFNEVIQKIKDIENGEIYFLNYGFSFEDITLKLQSHNYYLSTKQNGFIIQKFSDIRSDVNYHKDIMIQLNTLLKSKNIYPNGIPYHFQLDNLLKCAENFIDALKTSSPEENIIRLYTSSTPSYYKVVNDILNLLDEQLIRLIGDYIKALRYSLILYSDKSERIPNNNNIKLYRGLCLNHENSFEEFKRKFKVNDTIIFPAFSSTSLNENRAKRFLHGKGVLLNITADCTQINKPKSISKVSVYQGEDEVLLNCFNMLTIKKITNINDSFMSYECTLQLL